VDVPKCDVVAADLTEPPKVDLHNHAEAYARLEQLNAHRLGLTARDWGAAVLRLMDQVPPGVSRLLSLDAGLDVESLAELDRDPAFFRARLFSVLSDSAAAGAVFLEVRVGGETVFHPRLMEHFRAAERNVQERFPAFMAEMVVSWNQRGDAEHLEAARRAALLLADDGLAGVDFHPYPSETEANFEDTFRWAREARSAGLGVTCHAGEFSRANIRAALRIPGLTRIGHAVHATALSGVREEMADRGITIEACLTSNVVLGAVPSFEAHPLRQFMNAEVPVVLCSDDPVRLHTTIGREYDAASRLGCSNEELTRFTRNGVAAAFTTQKRREQLKALVEA